MENKNVKFTYTMAIDNALNGVLDTETVEKLNALKIQLAKKNKSGSSKPTKRQTENAEVLQPAVLEFLASVDTATATEVAKGVKVSFEVSTSRATSALVALKKCGKVVNTKTSKGSFYSLV